LKLCLLDTDILSLFFRNHPQVVDACNLYCQEYRQLSFSLITYYEILSGLKHRDAQKQLDKFLRFSQLNQIILLSEESVTISAQLYADLRKKGTPVDDAAGRDGIDLTWQPDFWCIAGCPRDRIGEISPHLLDPLL
jgi:tRNA(fMet)-specific endonuclease VapC